MFLIKSNVLLQLLAAKHKAAHTFKAVMDAFLLLPPPCEEPELLLPDLSLPSPPWLLTLGPRRCCPAPRRRPSWRLSLDIDPPSVQRSVGDKLKSTSKVALLSEVMGKHVR